MVCHPSLLQRLLTTPPINRSSHPHSSFALPIFSSRSAKQRSSTRLSDETIPSFIVGSTYIPCLLFSLQPLSYPFRFSFLNPFLSLTQQYTLLGNTYFPNPQKPRPRTQPEPCCQALHRHFLRRLPRHTELTHPISPHPVTCLQSSGSSTALCANLSTSSSGCAPPNPD